MALPTCNGTQIKANCRLDSTVYKVYIYHPAVAAKTHEETVTNYEKQVVSTCTLCADGSFSPTCAVGRGACSHHDGVAQYGAPRYADVPVYTKKTVVDSPAVEAYYEKVAQ